MCFSNYVNERTKAGKNFAGAGKTVSCYERSGELPKKNKPGNLIGNYAGRWECNINPTSFLIRKQNNEDENIYLERTGKHSDIF